MSVIIKTLYAKTFVRFILRIIQAYNIDFTSLADDPNEPIQNPNIKDEDCNVMQWSEHINCKHYQVGDKKYKRHICGDRHLRFRKSPAGVIPTIVKDAITERKKIKNMMKGIKVNEENALRMQYMVLDERQSALKIFANSMYGMMGAKSGICPFIYGAMAITYIGRMSIKRVQEENKGLRIIYGDTDSCFFELPSSYTSQQCREEAMKISDKMAEIFPKPMSLEFDNKIIKKFLLLTKKKYIEVIENEHGIIEMTKDENGNEIEKLSSKGSLLVKRDFCPLIKQIYTGVINIIFKNLTDADYNLEPFFRGIGGDNIRLVKIINYLLGEFEQMFSRNTVKYPTTSFVLTKSVNKAVKDYNQDALPAHVALASRMQSRGKLVTSGSRLRYVFTTRGSVEDLQRVKIEDYDYFVEHSNFLRLDYLYYMKSQFKQVDDLIKMVFGYHEVVKGQFKARLRKQRTLEELKLLISPRVVFDGTHAEGARSYGTHAEGARSYGTHAEGARSYGTPPAGGQGSGNPTPNKPDHR